MNQNKALTYGYSTASNQPIHIWDARQLVWAVVSAKCFFQLWQLCHIWHSLDNNSVTTLVHAFVTSWVDSFGSLMIGTLKTTDKLEHVLHSTARITWICACLTRDSVIWREECYTCWTLSTGFRVSIQVFRCLHNIAPGYLFTLCQPDYGVPRCHHLWSADHSHLHVPCVRLAMHRRRAFAYTSASNWNSLLAHHEHNSLSHSHLSNTTLQPFSSLSINTCSRFGIFFTIMRYISTVIMLLLLI